MEFVIQRSDLVRELQTVAGVVEKRATIPILANLLLEAAGDELHVGASDLEVTIRGSAKAAVVRDGSITLPAQKLHDIARSLPEAEVKFKLLDRNMVSIQCERTKYRIAGQPRDDFPQFPQPDMKQGVSMPAGQLRSMIERVTFAITHEDPRYSLNGALFLIQTGSVTLVATDGHRLAYVSRKAAVKPAGEEIRVIVAKKALTQVSHLTADVAPEETASFGKMGNQVFFVVGRHVLTSTLLEGSFPRYENVMPKSCETQVLLPTDDFADAVRRVSLLGADRRSRPVQFTLSKGKLDLSNETEMGRAEETLTVAYDGEEFSIGFNASYLIDFLQAVGTPTVQLELNPKRAGDDDTTPAKPGDKPGQLRPEPPGEMDYRYVVMPMQL
jgi:DNA polymerase-3 subunit beta